MGDAAVTFLLENLVKLLSENVHLMMNAKEELKELEKELKRMKAHLEDASKKQNMEEHFKESMRQMREVVYEVEDTIDSYISSPNSFGFANKVKDLRVKVKGVLDLAKEEFSGLANTSGSFDTSAQGTKSIRIKAPREDNVVGLEEQTDTLIEFIKDEQKGFDVFSIVGMPGLGKTTLAWKIYRDPRIQYEFPTLIWVDFSQDFNMRNVLLTILKKFNQNDMSSKTIDDLVELVRGHLKRGKFLIFIDDVWTTDAWSQIDRFLPKSNEMGKVLMTTRDSQVAKFASRSREPHQLEFLSNDKSLELLRIEVYGTSDHKFPSDLSTLARIIANKCGGLPLAIIVIGGILVDKSSTSEWRRISEDVVGHLIEKDRGGNLEKIVSWSYKNLPYDLRDCFLYLGMFPEDAEIPSLKLTQLWIAEGFIKKKPGESLEETAQDNLKDLINRNLVMVEKTKLNGEVKTCLVHDTIREFCQIKAGLADQNVFQEISMSKSTGCFEPSKNDIEKCRRLSIHSHVKDFFLKKLKLPNTRSFVCTFKEDINLEKKNIPYITDGFELIRVLEVSPIKFPMFPIKVTKLMHLRYLTLSCTELKLLPDSMTKLYNMQTLTVNTMQRTLEVKANIWDMLQLRHLKTKASIILRNAGKGKGGENLQTLSRLSTDSCTDVVFNKAKNLKTLGIRGNLTTILDSNCLEKLQCLEKLKLVNDLHHNVASENPLHRFPQRLPLKIKFLTLSATYLDWEHMSTVGKFSTLEVLKLKDNAFHGNSWDAVAGGFHQLEFLYISRTNLQVWTASDGSFPKLRSLVLKNCEKLQGVPNNLVENLTMLSMERVTAYAVRSARNIEKKKKEAEGNQKAKKGKIKLIVAPGDE